MTVGSIIRMMEGPLAPIPCASETAYRPCAECKDIEGCGTRIIMREVRDAISDVLDRTTLADLLRKWKAVARRGTARSSRSTRSEDSPRGNSVPATRALLQRPSGSARRTGSLDRCLWDCTLDKFCE